MLLVLFLDVVSNSLFWRGLVVGKVSSSEVLILSVFFDKPNTLILKDNLLDVGWPNKIVAPNSLSVAVKNIRRLIALIDINVYIETVHRKGYIFHCDGVLLEVGSMSNDLTLQHEESQADNTSLDIKEKLNDEVSSEVMANGNLNAHSIENRSKDHRGRLEYNLKFTHLMKACMFFVFFVFIFRLSFFMFNASKPMTCYELGARKVCGLFSLNQEDMVELEFKINEENGFFIYGYKGDLFDVEVFKVN